MMQQALACRIQGKAPGNIEHVSNSVLAIDQDDGVGCSSQQAHLFQIVSVPNDLLADKDEHLATLSEPFLHWLAGK